MSDSSPSSGHYSTPIKAFEPLIGTWKGEGLGFYPTIKVFKYGEEAVFSTYGKPIVCYTHRTWNLETNAPMHYESGFFRVLDGGRIEFINAQPTGITEIYDGFFSADKTSLVLNSKVISRSATAKEPHVTQTRRVFELKDLNTIQIFFDMATSTQPLQRHLESELTRV